MDSVYLLIPVFLPIVSGFISYIIPWKSNKARQNFCFAAILLTTAAVWTLIFTVSSKPLTLLRFTDYLSFRLRLDGAGKIFAALSSFLWPLTAVYATDYMSHEKHRGMFWCFFTVSYGVTMGIAMSANLLTMYLFYEMLTLATVPLVIHGMNRAAYHAGRKYMIYSFGGAAFAFITLAFLIYSGIYRGLPDFLLGGMADSYASETPAVMLILFVIAFIGFGVKAAIFPFHGWLPTAGIAPTPVTALLHAVAVVKAGAFACIRLTYYTFGADMLRGSWAQNFLLALTALTIVYGSMMALRQTHFKRRMAYSTVANLSYILFAVALMSDTGLAAGFTHIIFHSFIKIVAFFAAGAVLHYANKQYVDELEGIGRKMPVTFACFTVSALALTGVPPLNGFFSKWNILSAASENGTAFGYIGMAALLISALLTAIYMFSVAVKAYFPRKNKELTGDVREAGWRMTFPMVFISLCSVAMGIFANQIYDLIVKAVL